MVPKIQVFVAFASQAPPHYYPERLSPGSLNCSAFQPCRAAVTARGGAMKIAALFALSLTIAVAAVAQDTAPVIEHDPSRCFEVGSFPMLCAQVSADASLGQARAYFRASGTTKWYYVDLAEEEGELCSALPSPLPETPGVEYYLEVLDEQFRSAITPTTEARVVSDGSCGMPVYETAGVVSVFSLATGLLEVPSGFAATSVATVGGASGAGAAGGAAGGGGGGGLSGVTIGAIAGGAGAAAVAGVAVSLGGSDSSPGSISFVTARSGSICSTREFSEPAPRAATPIR